jgi:transcriptional regulator MraZ
MGFGDGGHRVQIDHLFGGSALQKVEAGGRVRLPRFVREVARLRSDGGTLVIGVHESDNCLSGYDPAFRRLLFADSERRRLSDESQHGRLRRVFGLTEEARIDGSGRVALPPMLRRLAGIGDRALFVGTGGAFEIWDPDAALASGDAALAELGRWRIAESAPTDQQEEQ